MKTKLRPNLKLRKITDIGTLDKKEKDYLNPDCFHETRCPREPEQVKKVKDKLMISNKIIYESEEDNEVNFDKKIEKRNEMHSSYKERRRYYLYNYHKNNGPKTTIEFKIENKLEIIQPTVAPPSDPIFNSLEMKIEKNQINNSFLEIKIEKQSKNTNSSGDHYNEWRNENITSD